MTRVDKFLIGLVALVCSFMLLAQSIIIQPTGSLARGIYVRSGIDRPLNAGDIVLVIFGNGFVRPDTYPYPKSLPWYQFVKVIAGLPGDSVRITDHGCFINSVYAGPIFIQDSEGRPISRVLNGTYQLQPDWYFVVTPHPRSFDSRYFGPVHISQLKFATPLWLLPSDNTLQTERKTYEQRRCEIGGKSHDGTCGDL